MRIIDLRESIYIRNIEEAPAQFSSYIQNIVRRTRELEIADDSVPVDSGDVNLYFGRGNPLPTESNRIVIGNRFYNKSKQYSILRGRVPTINTFENSDSLLHDRGFIAKRVAGQRQQGQLINQLPDDESGYVFQPLVNIIEEFRVVTYFMNGAYHVSGVYAKTGSNASFRSVGSSATGKRASKIAIKAASILGYGLAGVDIGLISVDNEEDLDLELEEAIIGSLASAGGRLMGSLTSPDKLLAENHLVIIEVNSIPSLSNPMIAFDLITSIHKNKV